MKKLGLLVMPLMAISLLASCGSKDPIKVSYTLTYTYDNGTTDKYVETYTEDKKTEKPTWKPEYSGYTFEGWFTKSGEEGDLFTFGNTLTTDTVVFAHWTEKPTPETTYTVTYVNYDGTELQKNENVKEGSMAPEYKKEEPIRPSDIHCDYAFAGWLPAERSKVYSNQVYTAKYDIVRTYDNTVYLEVDIPENDKTFSFNYSAGEAISIDWGENKPLESKNSSPVTHTYNAAGKYRIRIYGSVYSIIFEGNAKINNAYLGGSFISVEQNAFRNCINLTSVTISNSVTLISGFAFYGCTSLASIDIPNSVTSINAHAFENCSALTSVIIPDGVTSIGNVAFGGCSNLTLIYIPKSVTLIGSPVFCDCPNLTTIKVDTKNETYYSQDENDNQYNAIITKKEAPYPNTLIAGCKSTTIPSGVTSITGNAFYGCTSLTSIDIPNTVVSILGNAFGKCSNLKEVDLTAFVEEIQDKIPTLGDNVFVECDALTTLKVANDKMAKIFKEKAGWSAYADKIVAA